MSAEAAEPAQAPPRRRQIVISGRFNGPPRSANGGYACGLLAQAVGSAARVDLRSPPPLDVALGSCRRPDGTVVLVDGETLVATARVAAPSVRPPRAPAMVEVERAMRRSPVRDAAGHPFPTCFVCGPVRADGLRLAPGPVGDDGLHACVWTPAAELADPEGHVREPFVWAALDCPSGIAGVHAAMPAVLASMTVRRERPVAAGQPHVVAAWRLGGAGRKHRAASAVYAADGTPLAVAETLWITVARRP